MNFLAGAAGIYLVSAIYIFCLLTIGYKVYLNVVYNNPIKIWVEVVYIYAVIIILNADRLQWLL